MNKKDGLGGLSADIKAKIIALCKAIVPEASVWVYGSRARGDYTESSDIDIALDAKNLIDYLKIAELKDVLLAAHIPYKIDVIDLNAITDENFKNAIKKELLLWKE